MFDQATIMGDGVAEDRSHSCGSNALCPDRATDNRSRTELESRSPGHGHTDTPGTSASTPTSSKEKVHDRLSGVDPDYCRRILVRVNNHIGRLNVRLQVISPRGSGYGMPAPGSLSSYSKLLFYPTLTMWRTTVPVGRGFSQTEVKVWFQNRRTKQKKDQAKDSDKNPASSSESLATCNILRLLEQGRLLTVPPNSLLSPSPSTLAHSTGNGSPSSTSLAVSSTLPSAGGTYGLSVPSLGAPTSPRLGAPSLCLPVLGSMHKLPSGYGCGVSAFEPYTRIEKKEADSGGRKTSF
ncbi:VAX2 protein, partial [Polyodon spathula]|nr:VAX2 protein [Polyodon spathula]